MENSKIKKIHLEDLTVNYYDNLNVNKQAIVFIHGLGQNLNSWINQIEFFNNEFRVIALDLRGHGLSSKGNKKITINQFSEDIISLLNFLSIESANFIGFSLGGLICQQLTIKFQHRIHSVSLCNTYSSLPFQSTFPINIRINMIKNFDIEKLSEYYTNSCFYLYNKVAYDFVYNIFKNNNKDSYLDTASSAFLFDSKEILSDINIDTLIIAGDRDIVTPVFCSQYLNQHIKNSQLVIIPNCGHLSKIEQPKIFNDVLYKFLVEIGQLK